jgi:hypothetical protein
MSRRSGTTIPALSLMLCMGLIVLWVHSFVRQDEIDRESPRSCWEMTCSHGHLMIGRARANLAWAFVQGYRNRMLGKADVLAGMRADPKAARSFGGKARWIFYQWPDSDELEWELAHRHGLLARLGVATITYRNHYDYGWSGNWLIVPLWLPILLTALPPAWLVLGQVRRRRWARSGRCPGCGYNLMGNLSGVCPECGTPARGEITMPAPPAQKVSGLGRIRCAGLRGFHG